MDSGLRGRDSIFVFLYLRDYRVVSIDDHPCQQDPTVIEKFSDLPWERKNPRKWPFGKPVISRVPHF